MARVSKTEPPFDGGQEALRRMQAAIIARGRTIRDAVREARAATVAPTSNAAKAKGGAPVAATPIHGAPKVLDDPMFYPPHDERTETAAYQKVHADLTGAQDLPCMVCGVRNSMLKDPKKARDPAFNPYGASAMETHHHTIEWALANAIDPALFNRTLRPNLAAGHPTNATYARDMTPEEISAWVDHSPDNLWVLCDVHHRHRWVGIHEISYPLWVPQNLLRQDFIDQVTKSESGFDAGKGKATPPAPEPASAKAAGASKKAPLADGAGSAKKKAG